MNPNPALGRVLVRDGKWAVPPEERPKGWETMLPGKPKLTPEQREQLKRAVAAVRRLNYPNSPLRSAMRVEEPVKPGKARK